MVRSHEKERGQLSISANALEGVWEEETVEGGAASLRLELDGDFMGTENLHRPR